jgi:hypothetical protein
VRTAREDALLESIALNRLRKRDPEYDIYRNLLSSNKKGARGAKGSPHDARCEPKDRRHG